MICKNKTEEYKQNVLIKYSKDSKDKSRVKADPHRSYKNVSAFVAHTKDSMDYDLSIDSTNGTKKKRSTQIVGEKHMTGGTTPVLGSKKAIGAAGTFKQRKHIYKIGK